MYRGCTSKTIFPDRYNPDRQQDQNRDLYVLLSLFTFAASTLQLAMGTIVLHCVAGNEKKNQLCMVNPGGWLRQLCSFLSHDDKYENTLMS